MRADLPLFESLPLPNLRAPITVFEGGPGHGFSREFPPPTDHHHHSHHNSYRYYYYYDYYCDYYC
jgi:hypothetical protein